MLLSLKNHNKKFELYWLFLLCNLITAPTSMTSFGVKLYANRGCDPLCCQYTPEFSV